MVIKLKKPHPWSQSLTTKGTCSGKVEQRSKVNLAHLSSFYGPAACCHGRKTETFSPGLSSYCILNVNLSLMSMETLEGSWISWA